MKAKNSKIKKDCHSIELRMVKLSKESKKALKKFKGNLNEPVVYAIEYGNWHIPFDSYEFIDIKEYFERTLHDFYNIPEDVLIEVDCFETGILSFEKGIYPRYH